MIDGKMKADMLSDMEVMTPLERVQYLQTMAQILGVADDMPKWLADTFVANTAVVKRCWEGTLTHWHDWRDDDIAWPELTCRKCGETVLSYAKRRPVLAERLEGVTPTMVAEIEQVTNDG